MAEMTDVSTRKRMRKAEDREEEEDHEEEEDREEEEDSDEEEDGYWIWDNEDTARGAVSTMLGCTKDRFAMRDRFAAADVDDILRDLDRVPEAVLFLNTDEVDEVTAFLSDKDADEDARADLRARVADALRRVQDARVHKLKELCDQVSWALVTVRSPIEPLRVPKYAFLKIEPPGGARMVAMSLPEQIFIDGPEDEEDGNSSEPSLSEVGVILRHLACAMDPRRATDDDDTMNMSSILDKDTTEFLNTLWRDRRSVTALLEEWLAEWRCKRAVCVELTLEDGSVVYEK